jgi:hypothetical protein
MKVLITALAAAALVHAQVSIVVHYEDETGKGVTRDEEE